jgi:hypothetical protein
MPPSSSSLCPVPLAFRARPFQALALRLLLLLLLLLKLLLLLLKLLTRTLVRQRLRAVCGVGWRGAQS